jgi:hypothetical protein
LAEIATKVAPANIVIVPLLPKYPERNPAVDVLRFMRYNLPSNRMCKSFSDVVHHCFGGCNKLMGQPWRIFSIGLRNWTNEC